MPRAGQWMENVKAGFGVVLLLMAVWMLDRIVATEVTMSLVALILIVSSVYLGAVDSLDKGQFMRFYWSWAYCRGAKVWYIPSRGWFRRRLRNQTSHCLLQ